MQNTIWPTSYIAALSLTFDDGMQCHLETVIPELDRRGFKGTFYLNPRGSNDPDASDSWQKALQPWQEPAGTGHEMGNHTLTHPCSLNIKVPWTPRNNKDLTLDDIAGEMDTAQERLKAMFPHQQATSFAYPCYESDIGQGIHRTSYVPLAAQRFIAARSRGEMGNQPGFCDIHHLSSWNVEHLPGDALIELADQVLASGNWGIFTFHGIDEGRLSVSHKDFLQLLDALADRSDTLWVAPVAVIAQHLTVS